MWSAVAVESWYCLIKQIMGLLEVKADLPREDLGEWNFY